MSTKHYLGLKQVAERLGVTPGTLTRYQLPAPDVMVGTTRGWTAAAIDAWNASRPGRGNTGQKVRHADGTDHVWSPARSGGRVCLGCGEVRTTA